MRGEAGDQAAPLGAALGLQALQQSAIEALHQSLELGAKAADRADFPVGQREGRTPYLATLFSVEVIEKFGEADEQVRLGERGVDRQPYREPVLEFLDPPPNRARVIEPFALRRAGDFRQRDRDDDAVQRLPHAGALQQAEKGIPAGAVHRSVGILRRVAAGRVDQHRVFSEPPLAKPGATDARHRVLPHLGGQRESQPGIQQSGRLAGAGRPDDHVPRLLVEIPFGAARLAQQCQSGGELVLQCGRFLGRGEG